MAQFRHYRTGRLVELADNDPRVEEFRRGRRWVEVRAAEPAPEPLPELDLEPSA